MFAVKPYFKNVISFIDRKYSIKNYCLSYTYLIFSSHYVIIYNDFSLYDDDFMYVINYNSQLPTITSIMKRCVYTRLYLNTYDSYQ